MQILVLIDKALTSREEEEELGKRGQQVVAITHLDWRPDLTDTRRGDGLAPNSISLVTAHCCKHKVHRVCSRHKLRGVAI